MPSMYTKEFAEVQHGKRECYFCRSRKNSNTCVNCQKYSNCNFCPKCNRITENSCSACGCGSCYECGHRYSCLPVAFAGPLENCLPIGPYRKLDLDYDRYMTIPFIKLPEANYIDLSKGVGNSVSSVEKRGFYTEFIWMC